MNSHKRTFSARIVLLASALVLSLAMLCPVQAQRPEDMPTTQIMGFLDVMQKYIILTEQLQNIANDDVRSAGFAVLQLKDLYEDSGRKDEVIDLFKGLRSSTTSRPIRNLIGLQLADLLKESGKIEEAAQVYREIIRENVQ